MQYMKIKGMALGGFPINLVLDLSRMKEVERGLHKNICDNHRV